MGAGCSNQVKRDSKENIIVVPGISAGRSNETSTTTFSTQQTSDHTTIGGKSKENTTSERITNRDSQSYLPQTPPRSSQQIAPVKKSPLRRFFNLFKRKTEKKPSEQKLREGGYEYYDEDEYGYDDEDDDEDGNNVSEGREDSLRRPSTSYVPTYKGEDSDSQKKLQENKDKIKIVHSVTATNAPEHYQERVENDNYSYATAREYAGSSELIHQPYSTKQLEGIILPVAIPQTHLLGLSQQEASLPQPSLKVPREEEWKRHYLNVELVYDGRGLSSKEKGWIEQQITGLVNVLLESGQIPEHLSIMNEQMFHCKTVTEEEAGVNMKIGRTRTETTDPTMHHMLTPRKFQPQSPQSGRKGIKVGRDFHEEEFAEDDFDLSYDPYGLKQQRLERREAKEIKQKYGFVLQELGRKLSQETMQVVSDGSETNSYVTVREDFSDSDLQIRFENRQGEARTNGHLFPTPAAAIMPKPFVRVTVSEMENEDERKRLNFQSISEPFVGLRNYREMKTNEPYQPELFQQQATVSASSSHFFRPNPQSQTDQYSSQILSSMDKKQSYENQVHPEKSMKKDVQHFLSDSSSSASTVDTVISPDSMKQRIQNSSDTQSFTVPRNKSSTLSPAIRERAMNTKPTIKRSTCEIKQLVKQVKSLAENREPKSRPTIPQREIAKQVGRCLFQPYKVTFAPPPRKDHTSIEAGMKNHRKLPIKRLGSLQKQKLHSPNLLNSFNVRDDNKTKGYRIYKTKDDTGPIARKRISNSLLKGVIDPLMSTGRMKSQSSGNKLVQASRKQDTAYTANVVPLMRTPNSKQKDFRQSLSPVKTEQKASEDLRQQYRQIRHKVERNRQSISPLIFAGEAGKEKIYRLEELNNAVAQDGKYPQMKIQDQQKETKFAGEYQLGNNTMRETSMHSTRPKVIHSNININNMGSFSNQPANTMSSNIEKDFQTPEFYSSGRPINSFNKSEECLSTASSAQHELMHSLSQRPMQSNMRMTKQHVSFVDKSSAVNQATGGTMPFPYSNLMNFNTGVPRYGGSHPSLSNSHYSSDQNAFQSNIGFMPTKQNVPQFSMVERSASTDGSVGINQIQLNASTFMDHGAQNNYVHTRCSSEAPPFQFSSSSTPQLNESPTAASIQTRSVSYDSLANNGLAQNQLNTSYQRSYSTKPADTSTLQKAVKNNERLEVLQTQLSEKNRSNSDDIMWSDSPSRIQSTHSNNLLSSLAKSKEPGTSVKPRRWRQCTQEKEEEEHEAWWMPESWAKERGIGQYGNQWQFEEEEQKKKNKELQIIRDANVERIRTSRFIPL